MEHRLEIDLRGGRTFNKLGGGKNLCPSRRNYRRNFIDGYTFVGKFELPMDFTDGFLNFCR